jgi:hypothetical protein
MLSFLFFLGYRQRNLYDRIWGAEGLEKDLYAEENPI